MQRDQLVSKQQRATGPTAERQSASADQPQRGVAATLFGLQRHAGNRAAGALLQQATVPVLSPARPGTLQRRCACGGTPGPDGECAACRARRLARQHHPTNAAEPASAPPIVHDVLRAAGQPLDPTTRAFMEPRFGRDFGAVRVHAGARAAESARAVNALAYTVGRDVVFGAGQYAPGTLAGKSLLAHELTHMVQQRASAATYPQAMRLSSPGDAAEQEADIAAQLVVSGGRAGTTLKTTRSSTLQRLPFGIRLPTGIRGLDPSELSIARPIYRSSLDYSRIFLSNALGGGGRPFTTYVPSPLPGISGGTVINVGPAAYASPGSSRSLLIHELAHCWQSQHHVNRTQFMINSVASQAAAGAVGGDPYCYIPGKWFGLYAAEQIAQQVERGEAPIIAHIASGLAGAIDPANILSLSIPRWETRGAAGVRC